MNPDDLQQLLPLYVLLQEKSVTKAAQRLGVTQSGISHALSKLRERFSDPLLVRDGQRMVLTPRAEALLPPLEEAISRLEVALAVPIPFDANTSSRNFKLASADYGQFVILPPLMRRLENQAPFVGITARHDAEAGLASGEVDLAVMPLRTQGPAAGLRARVLFRERFVCVVRRGHPLESAMSVADFAEARHALIAPRGTAGGVVDELLQKLGKSRRTVLLLQDFLVAPHVVASSDLVITLPQRLAAIFAETLPLAILEHPLNPPGFSMSMVWPERLEHDAGHRWFRGELVAIFGAELPSARSPTSIPI